MTIGEKPPTRRGILSVVSSVYDPLGFVSPFLLPAKKILQELCQEPLGWDDTISEQYERRWKRWLNQLPEIQEIKVKRCLKPANFDHVSSSQLHIFSDASSYGYGSVAYLRLVNNRGEIHSSFLLGKSRVAPLKSTTIPRLELTAATVSVKLGRVLLKELDMQIDRITYYTDSTTVLHYLNSRKKRFPVFISNRVSQILDFSDVSQWKYVESKENPADCASRGLESHELIANNQWFNGPSFLRKPESEWSKQPPIVWEEASPLDVLEDATVHQTGAHEITVNPTMRLIEQYSSWYRLRKAVATYRRFFIFLRKRNIANNDKMFSAPELEAAEESIIQYVQHEAFGLEIQALKSSKQTENQAEHKRVPKTSSIYRLDPFVDMKTGILRVGGRLKSAPIPENMSQPKLLPKSHHVTTLIIRDMHENLGHAGRNHVLSALREKFWIIRGNAAVRSSLSRCVKCRKFRGPVSEQKMADLPARRMEPSPPFTYTGVDLFGPYMIKEGRKQMKRYGCLFTCLVSRAVHIETVNSLETDSFLNALRRFIARRGTVKELWCDNGTNFVGAEKALKKAIKEMDEDRIHNFLLEGNIDWKFNPPTASHMGGVWERQIRSARNILSALLAEWGERLDDEALRTLFSEVEAIINSRPLTTLSDNPDDYLPLSPNNLLTMKSVAIVPPPGQFQRDDVYLRQRWRRVQYLANVFWSRWKKEYLLTLQGRQKWNIPRRNMCVDDVVLLKDDLSPRCAWSMGRVISVEKDSNNMVRSVIVKTQSSVLKRPIHKLVLLHANENGDK